MDQWISNDFLDLNRRVTMGNHPIWHTGDAPAWQEYLKGSATS
jgi:hypothetical protein